jgi:hypothetical protein
LERTSWYDIIELLNQIILVVGQHHGKITINNMQTNVAFLIKLYFGIWLLGGGLLTLSLDSRLEIICCFI